MSIKKKLTLSQQIFLSMIALISFALLLVVILNALQIRNETIAYNNDRLARKDRAVAKTIEATIIYGDDIKMSFEPIIQNISHIHKLKINIYDLHGQFIISLRKAKFTKITMFLLLGHNEGSENINSPPFSPPYGPKSIIQSSP